jgi:segregation and condensation protein B
MAKEINLFAGEEIEESEGAVATETLTVEPTAELPTTPPPSPSIPVKSRKKKEAVDTGQYDLFDVLNKLQANEEAERIEAIGRKQVKQLVEALLFSSSDPLTFNKIREVTDSFHPVKPRILQQLIEELKQEYDAQGRAFQLDEINNGYLLRTRKEYGKHVELLYRNRRLEKLSPAGAEVLAIIAYKQPITRSQIEAIRGVDSSGVLQSLVERELIHPVGRLEAAGRPTLYGVTENFMKYFGLRNIEDLPELQV